MTVRPARAGTESQLLLDRFMPQYDVDLVHSGVFRVPPAVCYEAVLSLDVFEAPLIRTLIEAAACLGAWPRSVRAGQSRRSRRPRPASG